MKFKLSKLNISIGIIALTASITVAAKPNFVPGQVVVEGAPSDFADYVVVKYLPHANLTVLKVKPGKEIGELQRLRERGKPASLNLIVKIALEPNDPYFSGFQWNMGAVQGPVAWDSYGASDVVVAVLDTGLNVDNPPDGIGCVVPGYNAIDPSLPPHDGNFHGTHVSGTIAQTTNNTVGVAGLAYQACVMPIKVLGDNGSGSSADLTEGLYWAYQNGADVVNMSLGFGTYPLSAFENNSTYRALNDVPSNVTLVAASGNDNWDSVSYPASHPNVIAVGATDSSNRVAGFSNAGPRLDVVAPGVSIVQEAYGLDRDGVFKWAYWYSSGTSMASPHVAAAAALLLAEDPTLTSQEIRSTLTTTSRDLGPVGFDDSYGYGLIQVADALAALSGTIVPPPQEPPPEEPTNPEPTVELVAPVLSFANNGDGSITLNWTDESTAETGYKVYRSKWNQRKATYGNATVIATLGENNTSSTDAPGSGQFKYEVSVYSPDNEIISNSIDIVFQSTKGGGGGGGGKGKNR